MRDHEIKRAIKVILEVIKNTLSSFSIILTKKVILQKVLSDPIIINIDPNPNVVSKDTLVEKDLMFGLIQLLSEMKIPSSLMKLVIKHAILTTIVSGHSTTLLRHKAQLLHIHLGTSPWL